MAKAVGPYSPAVRAGDWLICSGQIGIVDGALVDGGVEAELRQLLANLTDLLAENGASIGHVRKNLVFLADMGDFATLNEIYVETFGTDNPPARSAVGVAALPLGAQVEIEAWAWMGTDDVAGALILAFIIVIAMPISIVMTGAIAAAILGKLGNDNAIEAAGEDNIYTDLNR